VKVKTKTGGEYSFKYADLPQIHEIVKPLLNDNGLCFVQTFDNFNLKTILFHESGEQIESSLNIEKHLNSGDPQTAGGVITYFKRYALSAILGLVTDEDDDANTSIGNQAEKQPELPWLNPNTNQWKDVLKYLVDGGTIDKVKTKYRISKSNQELLITQAL
jgi:hypothetical protein